MPLGYFLRHFVQNGLRQEYVFIICLERQRERNMPYLSTEQRAFVVEVFLRTGSYVTVQREFREAFPDRESPSKSTIRYNVTKYREHGTSLNRHKVNSGRRITVRTAESFEIVRQRGRKPQKYFN